MPRRQRFRVAIRHFLNMPGWHGKACIIASVEDTSQLLEWERRYPRLPDVYLNISDCERECTLVFDGLTEPGGQRNAIYKVNTLIAALERFRDALKVEIDLLNEREKERERERKREERELRRGQRARLQQQQQQQPPPLPPPAPPLPDGQRSRRQRGGSAR